MKEIEPMEDLIVLIEQNRGKLIKLKFPVYLYLA